MTCQLSRDIEIPRMYGARASSDVHVQVQMRACSADVHLSIPHDAYYDPSECYVPRALECDGKFTEQIEVSTFF